MTRSTLVRSLARLVEARERELDRLQAGIAAKESVRERFRANLERMDALCQGSGASGARPGGQAANCADFKQTVLQLADRHRQDLALHEADLAVARKALSAAAVRNEVFAGVLERERQALLLERLRKQRKHEDDIATQAWNRGRRP